MFHLAQSILYTINKLFSEYKIVIYFSLFMFNL